jgi:inhibitor of cysteine peptidase
MRVYRDPSIPIEVTVGQAFAISLESVPSTGYTWQAEYDPAMVALLTQRFVPTSSAIGGGGAETFEFQAKQLGETQLKMKYQREWETDAREIKLFRVHISS